MQIYRCSRWLQVWYKSCLLAPRIFFSYSFCKIYPRGSSWKMICIKSIVYHQFPYLAFPFSRSRMINTTSLMWELKLGMTYHESELASRKLFQISKYGHNLSKFVGASNLFYRGSDNSLCVMENHKIRTMATVRYHKSTRSNGICGISIVCSFNQQVACINGCSRSLSLTPELRHTLRSINLELIV